MHRNGESRTAGLQWNLKQLGAIFEAGWKAENFESKIKKRPELFSSGRLGSPPPELPNHEMDTTVRPKFCKCHLSNTTEVQGNQS